MQHDSSSPEHWLTVKEQMPSYRVSLGTAVSNAYVNDPRMLGFILSRYKFVAKMLSGLDAVLEVGCGEGFGAPIVGQEVKRLFCTDTDEKQISDNLVRCKYHNNISFNYWDFSLLPFQSSVDAAYLIDVIEHIYPHEEHDFVENVVGSLTMQGVLLIGTPNLTASGFSSKYSVAAHVNLKDAKALRDLCLHWFHNVFLFGMNDEVVHTGFQPMSHYLWALCVGPKR